MLNLVGLLRLLVLLVLLFISLSALPTVSLWLWKLALVHILFNCALNAIPSVDLLLVYRSSSCWSLTCSANPLVRFNFQTSLALCNGLCQSCGQTDSVPGSVLVMVNNNSYADNFISLERTETTTTFQNRFCNHFSILIFKPTLSVASQYKATLQPFLFTFGGLELRSSSTA